VWTYILRRTLYNIPVFLAIILLVMAALRVTDPVSAHLGKNATEEQIRLKTESFGLDDPFPVQYVRFLGQLVTFDFGNDRSWDQDLPVGKMILDAVPPSVAVMGPTLIVTASIAIVVGLVSAFNRGRAPDKILMFVAVIGMSISVLVYIILGQYFGAYLPKQESSSWPFEVAVDASAAGGRGFFFVPSNWVAYCMLPVIINVVVALGYDTRFYRAVMVEETRKDYIRTARAKGASTFRVMFVHMLKNAMIPIITRIMISLPFVVTGSILVEVYFNIPGMGRTLINAINAKDFPVIQTFTALFAALFIASNILTDVLYALADPRVRLS
jgi:peptide/nickel transport system permease protein|tara:strand:- start:14906 stop:15886 length:981 start_codon:yes stop_codon:yes gene_type:complete